MEREGTKIEGEMLNFVQLANQLGGFQYPICRAWAVSYVKKVLEFGMKHNDCDTMCGNQTWLYNRIVGNMHVQTNTYGFTTDA